MSDIQFHPPKIVVTTLAILLVVFSAFGLVRTINEVKRGGFIGQEFERVNTISVDGDADVEAIPDVAYIDLSVVTNGFDVGKIQDDNTRKMNAIIEFLNSQGVEERDIKTQNYNIFPEYDYTETGRVFRGYRITQTVNVKVREDNFDNIGTIFDQAVAKGANQVSNLRFDIDEKDELLAQARGEAIDEAQEKARVLARQLGVNLVRIVSFRESGSPDFPEPRYLEASFDQAVGLGGATAPSIQPGQTELNSRVTITYEIN